MKNNFPTVLLLLSTTTFFGFTVDQRLVEDKQQIELTSFLSARTHPDFLKYTKNIQTQLPKGTIGTVTEIKNFSSGNSGLKIKISNGPKAGESYWVYYNKKDPAIALIDKNKKNDLTPLNAKTNDTNAIVKKSVSANRDLDEHVVIETVKSTTKMLDGTKLNNSTIPPKSLDCDPETRVTQKTQETSSRDNESPRETFRETLTPQMALENLNSEELKFVGRDLMPGSDQNRTCMFQNSKVIVLYDNCMGSRKEPPATAIKIISKNGGEVEFYLENSNSTPASKLRREKYDSTWRISYNSTKAPEAGTINAIKKYVKSNELNAKYCFIGESFKAKSVARAVCSSELELEKVKWSTEAESFWKNPTDEWYSTLVKLRQLVEKAKY